MSPGQMSLPWNRWEANDSEIRKVAKQFVLANCYDPKIVAQQFEE
ncbi:hypothetical protein [Baaleninema simplex]|nr:hypothetical protein [Baaleninema simplex]